MMEQVLLLGRVESGGMAFKPTRLDLLDLCQRVADEQDSATNRRCPIVFTFDEFDPDAYADEGLLRRVLSNLLSNAVKYSPPGSPVDFAVQRRGIDAIFTVRDRGIGIPGSEAANLFTAFQRCTNVGEVPGTGLGLLIVKRCVDLHGGSISFESREGEGTIFVVRLPLFR
jgi:signal transduction histidine kinase